MAHLSMAVLQLELGIEDNLSIIEEEIDLVMKRFPWVQMVVLPELGASVPTSGPTPNMILFSGENASMPGFTSS